MHFWQSILGKVQIEMVCADPAAMLSRLCAIGVLLTDITIIDDFIVRGELTRKDYLRASIFLEKNGAVVRIIKQKGVYLTALKLKKRPFLLLSLVFLLFLSLFIPTRVFFIRVVGNTTVPTKLILEKAEISGVSWGASRLQLRSEKVKNMLLSQLPQLQWVGVNTTGCVAIISVQEKKVQEEISEEINTVSSIIAVRDGIIRQCTVTKGTALCKIGQAVKKGQVLVSGYTDCGIVIQATRAKGEIYAQTLRHQNTILPMMWTVRKDLVESKTKFGILIGKKRINLFNDSGNFNATCVRIYKESFLTLPGGFQLPIGFFQETQMRYNTDAQLQTEADCLEWIQFSSENYLAEQMVAGRILDKVENIQMQNDVCYLNGEYICLESIGKTKYEEMLQRNE